MFLRPGGRPLAVGHADLRAGPAQGLLEQPESVRSARGALPVLSPVGFPEPPPEPGVPVSGHRVLGVLGFAVDPLTGLRPVPHAAAVRRLPQRVDGDALDAAVSAYLQARRLPPVKLEAEEAPVRRVIAVDGKVVRGSRTATAAAIQLLAAMDHHGVVLALRQVASKSNEIPSFAPLLDGPEL